MKATVAPVPPLVQPRDRAAQPAPTRDWTVLFALCMGVGSLVLMFVLYWL